MHKKNEKIDETELFETTVWKHFKDVEDPRAPDNQKYSLQHLIIMIVCAIICGSNDIESILNYIESKIGWFKEKLGVKRTPSYKTIWWFLTLLDPEQLHQSFSNFITEIRGALCKPKDKEIVAIDGKTSRGTKKTHTKALHLVSAWSSSFGLLLAQVKTEEKSNEITAIPKLLDLLHIEGMIITIDAMGCQTKIAKKIVSRGGDYILSLKGIKKMCMRM